MQNKHSEGVIRRCKDIHRQVDTTITERRERPKFLKRRRTNEWQWLWWELYGRQWPGWFRERYANVGLGGSGIFGDLNAYLNLKSNIEFEPNFSNLSVINEWEIYPDL